RADTTPGAPRNAARYHHAKEVGGAAVVRTRTRLRNPGNAPPAWAVAYVASTDGRKAAAVAPVATLYHPRSRSSASVASVLPSGFSQRRLQPRPVEEALHQRAVDLLPDARSCPSIG